MTETARLVIEADARQVSSAAAELEKLSRVGRDTEQSVNRFAATTNSALASIKNSVVGIVAAYASIETVKSFANAALDIQRFSNSLQVGLGSVQAANESMRFLRDSASELGLDLRSSAAQFSSLAAAAKGTALEGQATRDIFLGIAKASTALGLSSDQAGGALLAIQQIVSKGKVSLEELSGQLGERLPGALQIAARSMGMTTQELNKLVSTGNLTAEQLLPKLADELNRTFGTQAQAAAQGLQAQINRFNTALFDMQVAIGQTGLIDFLSSGIQLATRLANALSGVFGSNADTSAIDKQIDSIARLKEQLASIEDRKNIPLIGGLLFDKQASDLIKQQIEDYESDVARMKAASLSVADTNEKVTETVITLSEEQKKRGQEIADSVISPIEKFKKAQQELDALLKAGGITQEIYNRALAKHRDELNRSSKVKTQQVSESQRFLDSLIKEASQLGKTSTEIKRMEAAKLGVLAAAKPFIERIEAENRALKDSEESMRNYQQMLSRAASITESVMTNEERFVQTQAELNRLLNSGAISIDTYNRALNQAEKQLQGVERTGRTAFDELGQFAIQAARNVQTAFADFFFDPFDKGLKGLVLSFANAVRRLIAEAAALRTIQGLGLGGALGLSSTGALASGGGGSALSLASLGSSAVNLLSTGFGATSLIGGGLSALGGASTLGAFGAGMQGGSAGAAFIAAESATAGAGAAAGMGASFAAAAGPLIAAYATTALFRSFAGDKRMGGGLGNAINAIGDIPILGDFVPVAPLMNALFGRGPLKQRGTTLSGTVGTEGFEEGFVQTDFRAKGGLFRSNKNDFARFDVVTGEIETDNRKLNEYAEDLARASRQIVGYINTTVAAVGDSLNQIGEGLGLSTEALNSFQTQIKLVSENGKFLEEAQIAEEIARISNEMALSLMPNVEDFSRMGESAVATLQRIGSEFDLLVNSATILGLSLAESREMIQGTAITDRTAFINAAGGMQAFMSQVQLFANEFLTEEQRMAPVIEATVNQLNELGLGFIQTRDQFTESVQSFGKQGGISESQFTGLLKIAGAADQIFDFLESRSTSQSVDTSVIQNERISLETKLLQLQGDTVALRQRELDALDESNRPLLERIFALEDEQTALQQNQAMLNERASLQRTLWQLEGDTAAIRAQELAALDPANRALQERIFALEDERLASENALKARAKLEGDLREAFSNLSAVVNNEKSKIKDSFDEMMKGIDDSIRDTSSSIGNLQSISKALESTVTDIQGLSRDEARNRLGQAVRQTAIGNQVNLDDIRGALSKLSSPDSSGFSTRAEFERSKSSDVELLGRLNDATENQISIEERTLENLEEQKEMMTVQYEFEIDTLSKIASRAQDQVNAIMGVDTSLNTLLGAKSKFVNSLSTLASNVGRMVNSILDSQGFASGGSHSGGLRIVGEKGAELELTGASRIISNSDLRQMLSPSKNQIIINDNSSQERKIENLLEISKQIAEATRKTAELLTRVTRDGESLVTTAS